MADISRIILPSGDEYNIKDSTARTVMTGATDLANGASGQVPAPTTADAEKFLRGDGTWQDGGRPMVILSYGSSTWNDFIEAYNNNVIVYCRASSNSNPASGSQTRMAFMAYVNANPPTEVEFQYYRSVSSHSVSQQGDQVFVYKLTNANKWTVTVREASAKIVAGTGLASSYSSDTLTLTADISTMTGATSNEAGTAGLVPAPLTGDEEKFLRGDGSWDDPDIITDERIEEILDTELDDIVTINTNVTLNDILNAVYPIGSYYFSDNNTSPANLFGGAWEPIQGKFLLGADSTYTAGSTGGNITHSHLYGIRFGAYYRSISLESNSNAGVLQYGDVTKPVKATVISNGSATAEINNAASNASKSVSMSHLQSITDTSIESSMPPYKAVYIWHRIA